jgi:predicted unusual protein kinase regulating ubiquinone biosynthesis (AarF/ABC1/UbiB family)
LEEKDFQLALLDAGIVSTLSPNDYRNFAEVFAALIKKDGKEIGRLILARSRVQVGDVFFIFIFF